MDANQVGARDHFHVVRGAPGYPAVVDPDDREAMFQSFGDGRPCRMVHRDHADVVAAIVPRRYGGFVDGAHVAPWLAQLRVFSDVQDFWQARVFIAAQRRIERMLGDDARLLVVVAEPAERAKCEIARFVDCKSHAVR